MVKRRTDRVMLVRYAKGAAVFAAGLASSGVASAADPTSREVDMKHSEIACPDRDPGERLHDGFFARSDTSLAFFRAIVSGADTPPRRSGILGVGQGAGISVGGTPERGLVVGGTVWTARMDPVFVENGQTVTPDDDSVKVTLLRLGPFLDFYPDPTRGFHLWASAALTAQIETDAKGNAIKPAALGAALTIGPGYEWFVTSQLSLGLLGRVSLGRVVRTPSEGEQHVLWIVPELALAATYH
ncbi:MAG TPA: hypothetical protein VK540_01810 [Polyangiaceae bacterium]|nr:hypothetical protein [Polyangiaceae bacterium]